MPKKPNSHITVADAAELLGVSQAAVRQAIYDKRLVAGERFGVTILKRSDILDYKSKTQPTGEKPRGRPPGSKDRKPRAKKTEEESGT